MGLPLGNELSLRVFPKMELNKEIGDIYFYGGGLKHSIDQYMPGVIPIDLAIQGYYQQFGVSDIITIRSWAVNALISKKLLMWTLYGGIGLEGTSMEVDYDTTTPVYNEDDEEFDMEEINIDFDLDGNNEYRITAGVRYRFLILNIFADYTISEYSVFNAGIGLSF
jgi:hypothetical protein